MKKRLILLLDDYPYSPGEYPFIKTELKHLTKEFDVSIICRSMEDTQQMQTDPDITVYHNKMIFGFKEKIGSLLSMIATKAGRSEITDILKGKRDITGRFYTSLSYYGCAILTRDFAQKHILKDKNEQILIYSYWFNSSCLGFLLDKDKYPGMKVISRIHGYDLYNERSPYNRQPFRKLMDDKIDALYFIAQKGQEYYTDTFGSNAFDGKYGYAPIGTEKPDRSETDSMKDKDHFELISCSDCIPLKRIHLIIEALASINENDISEKSVKWIHFGGGRLFEELKSLADKLLSDKNNIQFEMKGSLKVEEILQYYGNHHVDGFITTSETEGCPVSIQEALSYGIPIIGTDVGEIPNMLKDCGYLLSKDPSSDEVKDTILKLYKDSFDDIKTSDMRNKAYDVWCEKYDGELNAKKFVREIADIIA